MGLHAHVPPCLVKATVSKNVPGFLHTSIFCTLTGYLELRKPGVVPLPLMKIMSPEMLATHNFSRRKINDEKATSGIFVFMATEEYSY